MFRPALILSFVSTAAFAASYSVAVIPPPNGFQLANMVSINDSGQVAGYGFNGTNTQAFIGSPSGSTAIPLLSGWTATYGSGVNAAGRVAGYGPNGGGFQSFIWSGSGSTALLLPPGWMYVLAVGAVNASGQVAGAVSNGPIGHGLIGAQAFIGTTSGSAVIPLPAGWDSSQGYGVNGSGQVAGFVYNAAVPQVSQGFIGTTSGSTAIPLPAGWSGAVAYAVNDSGQVAGFGSGSGGATEQAFVGTVAGSTAIPLPAGSHFASAAFGSINNAGTVVGFSDMGGWIWDATNGTRLLNNLVPSGWVVEAYSISNNGLILATASYNGGGSQWVELSPTALPSTPAPSTLVLLSIGAMFCGLWLRFVRFRQVAG